MAESDPKRPPARGRRTRLGVVLVLGLGLLVAGGYLIVRFKTRPTYQGPARHVIVISLDTTRVDHLGCYGNARIRTPRLDALAAESILFADYMTVVPTTLASHTSLFTGRYPHTHGTPRNGFTVNDENVMLAEILYDAGFHTAGFLGSFALDSRFDFAQGFEHYDETFPRLVGQEGAVQNERPAAAVTDAVIAHLDQLGTPPNLFLFVHYFDPHVTYNPPAPYDTMYGPEASKKLPPLREIRQQLTRAAKPGSQTPAARAMAMRYAGEVSYMDEHVGRLIDDLRRRGILDDAIVIVTSDHGENLWDHPAYFNHGLTVYQSTVGAVCMIRLPGGKRGGTRVKELVASIDVLPTVLSFLGLPIPNGLDGETIDLTEDARPAPSRVRFAEASRPHDRLEAGVRWFNERKARCVRMGDWKYVRTPYAQTEELYNLAKDPLERRNLLTAPTAEITATAAELRRKLESWTRSASPLPTRFESSQREETLERLRSLGYAEQ